jgi:PAS domain S-box-containing protein
LLLLKAFTETLGFSEEELTAQPFVAFVHPEDKKATIDNVETLAQGMPIIKFPNRYLCKDGSYKWLEWTARSFVTKGDIYAIAYDITDREFTDATFRKALAMLQGRYTDQTTELSSINTLETVLNTTQLILENHLKDQAAKLVRVKAGFKFEQS